MFVVKSYLNHSEFGFQNGMNELFLILVRKKLKVDLSNEYHVVNELEKIF